MHDMKTRLIVIFATLALLTGCASPRIADAGAHQQILDKVRTTLAAVRSQPFPDYLMSTNGVKKGTEFDVSVLMKEFPNLSLPVDHTLDWFYRWGTGFGRPWIYVRRVDQKPYNTYAEYESAVTRSALASRTGLNPLWLDEIVSDGTPESYLQMLTLLYTAHQFYLYWHSNEEDGIVICTHEALERWADEHLGPPDQRPAVLGSLDPTPRVRVTDKTATVDVLCSSRAWGKVYWCRWCISREPPRELVNCEQTPVIETGGVIY